MLLRDLGRTRVDVVDTGRVTRFGIFFIANDTSRCVIAGAFCWPEVPKIRDREATFPSGIE